MVEFSVLASQIYADARTSKRRASRFARNFQSAISLIRPPFSKAPVFPPFPAHQPLDSGRTCLDLPLSTPSRASRNEISARGNADSPVTGVAGGGSRRLLDPSNTDRPCYPPGSLINAAISPSCPDPLLRSQPIAPSALVVLCRTVSW